MNSISDQRESYFKNKVTSLMTKGTVIKSLKQNPMKKKAGHEQVQCNNETSQKVSKKSAQKPSKKQTKKPQLQTTLTKVSHIQLKQKQRQFEMRMAYTNQQNNPDNLKKLLLQQQCRQQNISKKISNIFKSHQDRLLQRIKQRKLRTATYRTHSQFNQQSQTQPSSQFASNRKCQGYFQAPIREDNSPPANPGKETAPARKPRHKSLENIIIQKQLSPPTLKKRKNTVDYTKENQGWVI